MTSTTPRVLIITGMSGSGRRTACHTLEDLGWYVVDNLPPTLLGHLVQVAQDKHYLKMAVVLDVRTRSEFEQIPVAFEEIGKLGITPQILFLEADDNVIARRQESVRRPHPLQGDGRLLDGIRRERRMLSTLRAAADLVVDTSYLNVHQLSSRVAHAFNADTDALQVLVLSFGFKNGIPIDADMVLDVRFLPNPHWVPELRPQTGLSQAVSGYVLGQDGAQQFLDSITSALVPVFDGYVREAKRLAMIAVGCTGGKHRSTAMATELGRRLAEKGVIVRIEHRDLGLE